MTPDLIDIKTAFPLPDLLKHLGLEGCAKSSCRSPLRQDQTASWGIYQDGSGFYRWKDLGTNQGGDEIQFLAEYLKIDNRDNFQLLINLYAAMARERKCGEVSVIGDQPGKESTPPNQTGFRAGNPKELSLLSSLRSISVSALLWAQTRGLLIFNDSWNGHHVFGVKDCSGKVLEIRKLDGQLFPAYEGLAQRKSHAIAGSLKSWPVGILEAADSPLIVLLEGLPDFLAAHQFILEEQGSHSVCAPVGMLGASSRIHSEALHLFKDKFVAIYPHLDQNGIGLQAGRRWREQLKEIAQEVRLFDFSEFNRAAGYEVSDLNDVLIKIGGDIKKLGFSLMPASP